MATTRYIALLRGINVGGNNLIRMAELRACLEKTGFTDVTTYIASGNVLFSGENDQAQVEKLFDSAIEQRFGYAGPTVLLSEADFKTIIAEAPAGFGTQPDTFHSDVVFLKLPVNAGEVLRDMLALRLKDGGVDTVAAGTKAVYFTRLSAQRTKSRMSKITKLASYKRMTIRNWNTVKKLEKLLSTEQSAESS